MVRQGAKLTLVDYSLVTYTVLFSELRDRWPTILAEIERLPYPMDGLVVQFSDVGFRESLGSTAHHPRGQIAFKFSGIRRHTRLLAVEWSFGKNCLTPVAELEPVEIGGITIRHATLHNRQNIEEKDIRIGDTVVVERAGDVIPYIVSAIPGEERRSALIENCPCCGTRLANDGPELRCLNPDCLETSVQRLTAAIRNIGIERLGEPNVRKMMKNLGVRKLWDIFKLSREQILSLEGFKEKSADNLLREIEAARRVPDFQVLAALNITGIGKTVAKDLLSRFPLETLRTMTENDLCNLRGIGPERAAALAAELRKQSDILDELLGCVNLIRTSLENDGIKRPTICFTGKMPEKREFYATLARERGFDPIESVSSSLALLVAMNPEENGGKLKAARKLGIAVVSLEEWLKNEGAAVPDVSNKPDASKPKIEAEKWDDTPRIQPDLFA
jgi:DNA ligase (NAD+)